MASDNIDPYFVSLVAASLYNVGRNVEANNFANLVVNYQTASGNVTGASTSITCSMGSNLEIETTSIAVIAWLNNQS